jgi:hypothetical protein
MTLLLIALIAGIDAAMAMLVLAAWARPEKLLRILLAPPRLGEDWFDSDLDEAALAAGGRLLERLRLPLLLGLLGVSFASGVLMIWLRVARPLGP